jgi:hypothetical protein
MDVSPELVAAILAAGMLPTVPLPSGVQLNTEDEVRITLSVSHAVGLYRSVLTHITLAPP